MIEKQLVAAVITLGSMVGCSCFVRGTRITTARGSRAIEELEPGELVVCWDPERRAATLRPVASSRPSTRREIARLRAGERSVGGVTLDHPMFAADAGRFVDVGDLSLGSRLLAWRGDGETDEAPLDALEVSIHERDVEVFDLSIDGPEHDFFADGLLAHNKEPLHPDAGSRDAAVADASTEGPPDAGSCFAEDTLVATPDGPRAIGGLREGDRVWSWDLARNVAVARPIARVRVAEREDLVAVRAGTITIGGVTPEHPIFDASRRAFVRADALTLRSRLLSWIDGEPRVIAITSLARRPRAGRVVDLTIDGPEHDFFAEGVLVHNKSDAGRDAGPPAADAAAAPGDAEPSDGGR